MFDEQLLSEIRDLLAQDRKIEAIRRLREATGLGLKEAKDAVEAVQTGGQLPALPPDDAELDPELLPLLQAGKKIDAIKLYRERTGLGLAESKQAVEAIAARHGIATGGGCAGVLLAIAMVGLIAVGLVRSFA